MKMEKRLTIEEAGTMLAGMYRYLPTNESIAGAARLLVANGYDTKTPGLYEAAKKVVDAHGWDEIWE